MVVGLRARRWRALVGVLLFGVALMGLGTWSSFARADGGSGSLLAWGWNGIGQLGDGTTLESSVPVAVSAGAIPSGTTITQIAVNGGHSLALSSTGQLYAWGGNFSGELGDGTNTESDVPVAVSAGAIGPGTTITRIAAGNVYSLAVSSTGQLYAWGENEDGQLGDGTTTNSNVPVAVSAGAIPPGTTFTQVSAGADNSLALSSTGKVYAWGYNNLGALGDGTTANSDVPVAVSAGAIGPGTTITQVSAAINGSLALSSTGKVYAWGYNNYGQLGDGTNTESDVPVAVSAGAIGPGTTIAQVAAGGFHSLALSSTGQLYAWGESEYGELGDGTNTASDVPVAVSAGAIPPGTTFTQIAAGLHHSVALSSTGKVYDWGNGEEGELGDGTNNSSTVPVATILPAGSTIEAIASGSYASHTLAIVRGPEVPETPVGTSPSGTTPTTQLPAVTSSTSPGATPGVASTPKAIEELELGCSASQLVLNDVYIQGGHVAIRGSAAKSLVGKKVKILFNEGKQVATATVGAGGQYETTAPLPPAKIRDNLNTRYTAEVGKLRSVHLKLVRRLLLEPPKASGTAVTLTGQVTLPLTKPIAPVVVEQQLECGKTTIAKTFTPPASGRFDITVTVPANAKAGIFRLTSKVAANKHATSHGFTTFSLPLPVALG